MRDDISTYATIDGVLYVVYTVFPRTCNQNELVPLLIQPLLYARIITALLRRLCI